MYSYTFNSTPFATTLHRLLQRGFFHLLLVLAALYSLILPAQATICAEVRIEIVQELTLERQGFIARLELINPLDTQSLTNVGVALSITDEFGTPVKISDSPNSPDALFFVREDTLINIEDIAGGGEIAPETTADIRWLIVPVAGSGGDLPEGKTYFVGATLQYSLADQPNIISILPDAIQVKPQPKLSIDYFLTREIRADDPLTAEIEPSEPFTLGVRVSNNGSGSAYSVGIESAQPKIIENRQGLAISFRILGSTVNDHPATPSLTLNLGDIPSQGATVGRWIMETDLAGVFEDFSADFTHSDELGGKLTSLITAVEAHDLIQNVRVDLPGRDRVDDFLAERQQALMVFESSGVTTPVIDRSDDATLEPNSQTNPPSFDLQLPATEGFFHLRLPAPEVGAYRPGTVLRSDGKQLPAANVWISRERPNGLDWVYYLNLFDVNSTGTYVITYKLAQVEAQAPVLGEIPNRTVAEGQRLSFTVTATDPNGTIPTLSATPLPAGAEFSDQGDGLGEFDWTPTLGQADVYQVTFTAGDGVLESSKPVTLRVCPVVDSDCDGMDDAWELEHFGTLDRDGSGDFDGDGVSDLDEFLAGTNPTLPPGPTGPTIQLPADSSVVTTLRPDFNVLNGTHWEGTEGSYHYEVYGDAEYGQWVADGEIAEQEGETRWSLDNDLTENTYYWWRVRTYDGNLYSEWVGASFFVNIRNDWPSVPMPSFPLDGTEVSELSPTLEASAGSDLDGDPLRYRFEVATDPEFIDLVADSGLMLLSDSTSVAWPLNVALEESGLYYWRVSARDPHGATAVSEAQAIIVNTVNDPPGPPGILSPAHFAVVSTETPELVASPAQDLDDDEFVYIFQISTRAQFDNPELIHESPAIVGSGDTVRWVTPPLPNAAVLYYWRVKANDGYTDSPWVSGFFQVRDWAENRPPAQPSVLNPGDDSWVPTLSPAIRVYSQDLDWDQMRFHLEVYADEAMTEPLEVQTTEAEATLFPRRHGRFVLSGLDNLHWYYWRARAGDYRGAHSEWTALHRFFVNDDGIDDRPAIILPPPLRLDPHQLRVSWTVNDVDSDAEFGVYYSEDRDDAPAIPLAEGLSEDQTGSDGSLLWDTRALSGGNYRLFIVARDDNSEVTEYTERTVPLAEPAQRPVYGDLDDDGLSSYRDFLLCWDSLKQRTDPPIAQIVLAFNAPVEPVDFPLEAVTLSDPYGAVVYPSTRTRQDSASYRLDFDPPLTAEGDYQLTLTADITSIHGQRLDGDQDGTEGEIPEDNFTVGITVDGTPPDPPEVDDLVPVPAVNYYSETIGQLTLSGPHVPETDVLLNGEVVTQAREPTWSVYRELSDGINTFTLRSRDLAGNLSDPVAYQVIWDRDPPSYTVHPGNNAYLTEPPDVYIDYTETGSGLDLPESILNVSVGNSSVKGSWSDNGSQLFFTPTTELNDGLFILAVSLVDRAGNGHGTTSTFKLDRTNPEPPSITSEVPDATNTSPLTVKGTKEWGDAILLNGAELVPNDVEGDWSRDIDLVLGNNELVFTAKDKADRISDPPIEFNTVFDQEPPGPVTFTATSAENGTAVDLDWRSYDEAANGGDIGGYSISRDSVPITDSRFSPFIAWSLDGSKTYTDSGLIPGSTWYYAVIAWDQASNHLNTVDNSVEITLDDAPPRSPREPDGRERAHFANCTLEPIVEHRRRPGRLPPVCGQYPQGHVAGGRHQCHRHRPLAGDRLRPAPDRLR